MDTQESVTTSPDDLDQNWREIENYVKFVNLGGLPGLLAVFKENNLPLKISNIQIQTLSKTLEQDERDEATGTLQPTPHPETAEEMENNRRAMQAADRATGLRPTEKAAPFNALKFHLWDNAADGNCLYHALHSTGPGVNLEPEELTRIRKEVGDIRKEMPDSEREANQNWHEISNCLRQQASGRHERFVAAFRDNKLPQQISNLQLSAFQTMPGYTAGDLEIQQWLAIEGNQGKTVTVIDSQLGRESIVTFQHGKPREAVPLDSIDGDATAVRKRIANEINSAVNQASLPLAAQTHIALYRSTGHFQRIRGQKTEEAMQSAETARRADQERQFALGESVDITRLK